MSILSNIHRCSLSLLFKHILRVNGLNKIEHLDLDVTLEKAIELYGDYENEEENEEFPEARVYTFTGLPFHEVTVTIWKGKVHRVTYFSYIPSPAKDLIHVGKLYGKDVGWDELEDGYFYQRKDQKVNIWCSVAPYITVETNELFSAISAHKQKT
ncbi:hypothetical protein [Coraliomargarita akajimensis]|nr:hypothetical protein [Coraliomargarita akajimensis]